VLVLDSAPSLAHHLVHAAYSSGDRTRKFGPVRHRWPTDRPRASESAWPWAQFAGRGLAASAHSRVLPRGRNAGPPTGGVQAVQAALHGRRGHAA